MRQGPLILHEQKEQMNARTLPNGFPVYMGPREISLTKLVCKRATLTRPIIFFANDFRFEDETNTTMSLKALVQNVCVPSSSEKKRDLKKLTLISRWLWKGEGEKEKKLKRFCSVPIIFS